MCETCHGIQKVWNGLLQEMRGCPDCNDAGEGVFVHVTPKCEHDFKGWRELKDGRGGETVCTKCGMGAMSWSLRTGL
jgi:hypothetical protein